VVFPTINLLDSTHDEPHSHGFVQFSIKPKAGLPLGTQINNRADIYFDYNSPVITNTAIATIYYPLTVIESQLVAELSVFPNPVEESLNLHIGLKEQADLRVDLINPLGQVLNSVSKSNALSDQLVFDMQGYPAGVYFIKISVGDQVLVRKVVKE
jgi:hypothetical protein